MIDLDRFKEINDSLGHRVGDDILRALGPRLVDVAEGASIVARLGGDEFGVLLPAVGDVAAAALAERICEVVREPFELVDMTLRVDASVGIAVAPEHGVTADVLLQRADMAMYGAKRGHRAWEIYSEEHDVHTPERLELIGQLRDAIARGELVPYYQPKLDLRSGCLRGVEALVRWEHPVRGLLTPDRFLDLVEESGLVGPLAMTVLDQALEARARWAQEGIDLTVAVNLSTTNLRDDELPEKVGELLARHGVPGRALILEITEDSLICDSGQVRDVLESLRDLGVELSVDDYGTGFSSLAYLRDLPVSELKLDRTFLADAADDERTVSIIRSTVELAHTLELRIVAEGVEDEDGLALIAGLGCDVAQGYYLGRPAAADDAVAACISTRFDVSETPARRRVVSGRRRRRPGPGDEVVELPVRAVSPSRRPPARLASGG
jgi:diguanylate cyclase (GGDEF)-like protein